MSVSIFINYIFGSILGWEPSWWYWLVIHLQLIVLWLFNLNLLNFNRFSLFKLYKFRIWRLLWFWGLVLWQRKFLFLTVSDRWRILNLFQDIRLAYWQLNFWLWFFGLQRDSWIFLAFQSWWLSLCNKATCCCNEATSFWIVLVVIFRVFLWDNWLLCKQL